MVELDITSLINAVNALKDSILTYNKYNSQDEILKYSLRSGVIQNFEVAYELSWKFMKRWLEINISPDIVTGVTRKEFYRIAQQNLLISNVKMWWIFHEARNNTSHIYDEDVADETLNTAFDFLQYGEDFIKILKERI
ncbi:MAG: nucleotidyltransferase substrate binding protein [Methanobrevibacter sp.]|nr:nucleotidyltransferase substrate binding protein [Candidatus Methanovirga basalitermitum]